MLERLGAYPGERAERATLWTFLDRCGLTFKRVPPTQGSMIARMF